ncbi:AraC family two component transcriptional regulator [Herbinix hemicellulosilytica]|uniref:Stage 0 sporulation protein A homolog n=1 Tax=Herbinix hemicellulosilytica TaxID=1564487 RepID=A0A0H5SF10_HERHM|nr:helix-turn-helix domain-containing protein [Herbinix hemicellulosilytica]RBP56472.1 AraC family two component transcriptional regulator [Herbinix hemicellulosilytica]CRZ34052.1 hypothetical protein HHT355_0849 [Herbinix hemicellulosilytica]
MNILIVDDDLLIRNWLKILMQQIKNIDTTIYEASNGGEALEICRNTPIELVITDIKMPVLNGLDLITELKNEFPSIRFCVLSSYDDFSYVKSALKAGALDYILKPEMKLEDLTQLFAKVKNSIDLEKKYSSENNKIGHDISGLIALYKEYVKNELITDLESFLKKLHPNLTCENLMIIVFTVSNKDDKSDERIASITMDTFLANNYNGVSFPIENEYFAILYNSSSNIPENQEEEYQKLITILNSRLSGLEHLQLGDSILLPYKANKSLKILIDSGLETIRFCIFYGTKSNKPVIDTEQHSNKTALYQLIQKYLEFGDYNKIAREIIIYMEDAYKRQLTPSKLISAVRGALRILLSGDIIIKSSEQLIVEKLDSLQENISSSKTYKDLIEKTNEFLNEYCSFTQAKLSGRSSAIQAALQYIEDNYMNKLTLDKVANYVYLNSSYLSQLFKKEMNMSFSDYVEQIRLKHAKILLKETDYSMNQIAEAVGFSSQNYFTRIFKKSTGITPIKYKNMHQKS